MAHVDEVKKWLAAACALHIGALDYNRTTPNFGSTEEAIAYLCNFQTADNGGIYDDRCAQKAKARDYFYTPDNTGCSKRMGLSVFFRPGHSSSCVLCNGASVHLGNNASQYKLAIDPHHTRQESDDGDPELKRLKHLAILHTPYFVMLFVGLVEQKPYTFHGSVRKTNSIVHHLIQTLNGVSGPVRRIEDAHCGEDELFRTNMTFLKLWWRYQDRQSNSRINMSIPSYFVLGTKRNGRPWTPAFDAFETRKPEPLYSFVETKCLYHQAQDVQRSLNNKHHAQQEMWQGSPVRVREILHSDAVTFALSTLIPRRHLEQTLHNAVRTHKAREVTLGNVKQGESYHTPQPLTLSKSLQPRIDCIGLEHVNLPGSIMLHVVSTLDAGWQTLNSWLTDPRAQFYTPETVSRVLIGVLGSLKDLCELNQRPCAALYTNDTSSPIPALSPALLVHSETGETLSLLPYVSMPKTYRASQLQCDELQFRAACMELAMSVAHVRAQAHTSVMERSDAATSLWDREHYEDSELSGFSDIERAISEFCRTGLVYMKLWSNLKSMVGDGTRNAGLRITDDVWLGQISRDEHTLKAKFAWLKKQDERTDENNEDVFQPMCLLEVLRNCELSWGGPPKMETERCVTLCSFLSHVERYCYAYNGQRDSEPHHRSEYLSSRRHRKRTSETSDRSAVAQKVMATSEETTLCYADSTTHINDDNGLAHLQRYIDEELKEQLDQGSRQSSLVEDTIPQTRTYRDEDFVTSDTATSDDPGLFLGKPIHGEFSEALFFTANEMTFYDPQSPNGSRESHAQKFCDDTESACSINTADVVKQLLEHDTRFNAPNPFFTYSGTEEMCGSDILERAMAMYYPKHTSYSGRPRRIDQGLSTHESQEPATAESTVDVHKQVRRAAVSEHNDCTAGPSCAEEHPVTSDDRESQRHSHASIPEIQCHTVHEEHQDSLHENSSPRETATDREQLLGISTQSDDELNASEAHQPARSTHASRDSLLDISGNDNAQQSNSRGSNCTRWKSRGLSKQQRAQSHRAAFHKMTYQVSRDIEMLSKAPTIPCARTIEGNEYLSHPSQGLTRPARYSMWDYSDRTQRHDEIVILDFMSGNNMNRDMQWTLGVEYSGGRDGTKQKPGLKRLLTWPRSLDYQRTINTKTLDCKTSEQTYRTINLSAPPHHGFSHTELLVDSLPNLSRKDVPHLISMKATNTKYLGVLCTAYGVPGLVMHRLQTAYRSLVNILDMHTRLQVHSFVPRTFALHCVVDELEPEEAVGVFVSETPGSMNLGQSCGFLTSTNYDDTITFTYHVLKCLLRVQILSLRVLGFTMRCIQPARIWKLEGKGFRVDMLGCLIDTLYVWDDNQPTWGASQGLASIWNTLKQLRLHTYVPQIIATELQTARDEEVGETLLLRVYRLCEFADSNISEYETWEILGSDGRYTDFVLPINTIDEVHPYGPFFVTIQNQIIKWNRAIVVEPLTSGLAFAGQLNPISNFTEDVLARALLDALVPNTYPEPTRRSRARRRSRIRQRPIDAVQAADEALRLAAGTEESSYYSTYSTC